MTDRLCDAAMNCSVAAQVCAGRPGSQRAVAPVSRGRVDVRMEQACEARGTYRW